MNMDNKKFDDLDKLFQSRLNKDEIVDQNWNKAPQSAFDGAMAALDKEDKKRRRRLLWWILPLAILSGFTFITMKHVNRIHDLENTLATLQVKQENMSTSEQGQVAILKQSTASKESTDLINKNPIPSQGEKETSSPLRSKTQKNSTQKEQNFVKTASKAHYISSALNEDQEVKKSETPARNNLAYANEVEDQKVRKTNAVAFLPALTPKINWNQAALSLTVKEELEPVLVECCQSKGWQIYTLAGINASTIKMTNVGNPDFSLTGYEKYYTDGFAGLGLEYAFHPKWTLFLEGSYNKMHVKSIFENMIQYDKTLEYTDAQGLLSYDDDYEVATVMGRASSAFSLDLANKSIEDNEELLNHTLIDNSFETISIGLGSQYLLLCLNNWSLDLGASLHYNHLLQVNEQMESSIYHKNGLMFRESFTRDPMEKANQNFWSLAGNIRLAYQFSDHLGLKLNLGSSHSLHSIRKVNTDQDPKTFINQLKAAVQFQYHF